MNLLKKEVKNTKTVFLGAIAVILFIVACTVIISTYREQIWPSKDFLFKQKRNYHNLQAKLEKVEKLHVDFAIEKEKVESKVKTFYKIEEKLEPDVYFRERIEHAAKFSNLILKSVSSIRKNVIKEGTFSLEVSISAEGDFEKVLTFFQELSKKAANIYWVSCYLRPTKKKEETLIDVSGVLRIICTDGNIFKTKKQVKK
jgi:hypothetical protein